MKPNHFQTIAIVLLAMASLKVPAQVNMFISNPEAVSVLKGDYNPSRYHRPGTLSHPDSVRMEIIRQVSPVRLIESLEKLETFYNRNSGSDTLSNTTGIGACRTWILSRFEEANKVTGGRLITGYLEFDADICTSGHHKNPFILIPGTDTTVKEILVVEGHYDTRNEDRCDNRGYTPGIEDNGSGTVLILELARVLSQYSFRQTILLTTPTGEDQGLWGAKAWAAYLSGMNIPIRAVLNNDIVGGIYCGKTSPAPSCPYYGHVDSTHVRVFSYSQANSVTANSPHKQLARYMKFIQDTRINPYLTTPMTIRIMAGEDRDGRSGDHTPFRQKGYPAVRIVSANEHGNGTGTYPDRNHSTRDVVGKDTDADGKYDSLFINPGYIARNTILNGVVTAQLASGPRAPKPAISPVNGGAVVEFSGNPDDADQVLIGIRKYKTRSHEFDSVWVVPFNEKLTIPLESGQRTFVSVALIRDGVPGLFSAETDINLTGIEEKPVASRIIMKNFPNPWDGQTTISIENEGRFYDRAARLEIQDLLGRTLDSRNLDISLGFHEVVINSDKFGPGVYACILFLGGGEEEKILMVRN